MHADAGTLAGGIVKAEVLESLTGVVVRLATGNNTKTVRWSLNHVVIEVIGFDVGARRGQLDVKQPLLLHQRWIGPADMDTVGRHDEIRNLDGHTGGVDDHGRTRFNNFLDGFHTHPHACKAAQRDGMKTGIQNILYGRGKENRKPTGLENLIALVSHR